MIGSRTLQAMETCSRYNLEATAGGKADVRSPRSLQQHAEFQRLAEVVASIADSSGSVAYLSNPGNLGDALIDAGSRAFLRRTGVRTTVYSGRKLRDLHRDHYKMGYAKHLMLKTISLGLIEKYPLTLPRIAEAHNVAVICGSGGFCKEAAVASQIARLAARHFRHVIVLPSTYAMSLADYPGNVTFFARDRLESLRYAAGRATFCHDMAFFLDPEPASPIRPRGVHLRTDNEASGRLPIPSENFDISAAGTERDSPTLLFEEIGKSETIVTDRLHLGIAAALLGRRTFLFSGSYFKIRAIYESSIRQYFPHVDLLDSPNQLPSDLLAAFAAQMEH